MGQLTKIWILQPRQDLPRGDDPWEPWFDRCFGIIAEAVTEGDARNIAHDNCVCTDQTILRDRRVFLDPKYTTCAELVPCGQNRFIMGNYRPA